MNLINNILNLLKYVSHPQLLFATEIEYYDKFKQIMKTGVLKMVLRNNIKPKLTESFDAQINEQKLQNHSHDKSKFEEKDQTIAQIKGIVSTLQQALKAIIPSKRNVEIEPRDRMIQYEIPNSKNLDKLSKEQIELWVTGLCREVFSTTFHYYEKGWMSYEQAKIFCSENIISNIIRLNERYRFSSQEVKVIDQHINDGVTSYLLSKYPMTETQIINKALESIVKEVDNIEALENDAFFYSKDSYGFQYRESGNYNDLIMKLINDLMIKIDEKSIEGKQTKTVFNQFYETMQQIFEKVEKRDWNEQDMPLTFNQDPFMKKISDEKYRSRVKAYTSTAIGRKISENVSLYSEAEINSLHTTIKHPAILRILTKWAEELWNKFDKKNYFLDRSENVKTQKGGNINTYFAWMKVAINDMIEEEKTEIERFLEELFSNNYDQQAVHLFRSLRQNTFTNVERIEKASGIFAVNIVNNLHSYILLYLNRLIHGLLKVSKKVYHQELVGLARWTSPPNLISFKIGDLMRCKIASQEKQIYQLYNQLNRISENDPDTLKIIRIKNRLKEGTNDILINIRFRKNLLCQMQLAINSDHSNFLKCSNKYNHFIYELKRSIFGPLTEFCSIWRSLDSRSKLFKKIATDKKKIQSEKIFCLQSERQHKMERFNRPFVCSRCSMTYSHNNYIQSHRKCVDCERHSECGKCRIEAESQDSLKAKMFKNHSEIGRFCSKLGEEEQIPKYGACFLIQSKHITMQLFAKLTIRGKTGLFVRQNKKVDQLAELNSKKQIEGFRDKYIVFKLPLIQGTKIVNIEEREAKNEYLLPKQVKTIYKKEKQFISLINQDINSETCGKILDGKPAARDNIKCLELPDNKISDIGFICSNFKNLKKLVLSRNHIQDIEPVSKLINLQHLNLRDNQISVLPPSLFNLFKLESLNLRNNFFSVLPPQLSQLTNLTKIELNELKLRSLPDSFSQMVQLRYVDLSQNELGAVPPALKPLKNLEHLALSTNKIVEVPLWLNQFANLNVLKLQENKIANIKHILQLKVSELQLEQQQNGFPLLESRLSQSLNLLVINRNKVSQISDQFFADARSLEIVEMKYNELESLPESLGVCKRMKNLDLTGNRFASLPRSIGSLLSLQVLELSNNNFSDFPSQLGSCYNLVDVSLANNPLRDIPGVFFYNCFKLERINLAKTQLRSLPSEIGSCLALKKLILSETQIQAEEMGWLSELRCLEQLDVSRMKLSKLPPQISELHTLCILNARENEISHLSEDYFHKLVRILSLNFENNKIKAIPPSLKFCQRVKEINFSNNLLIQFPTQIYGFEKLHKLNLSHNQIGKIYSQRSVPSSLTELQLKGNKIEDISDIFFKNADNLKKLSLECNLLTQIPRSLTCCAKLNETYFNNNQIKITLDVIAKLEIEQFVKVFSEQEETNNTDIGYIIDKVLS